MGAFFTFGATEVEADSIAVALTTAVARALAVLAKATAGIVAEAFSTMAEALATDAAVDITASGLVGGLTGAGGTTLADSAQDSLRQLFGQEPLSSSDAMKDVFLYGVIGSGTAGGLAKIGELTGAQLSALLSDGVAVIDGRDPVLATKMAELAKALYGSNGKVTAGVLATAASQLMTAQQIDAQGIISDRLADLMTQAAQGGG